MNITCKCSLKEKNQSKTFDYSSKSIKSILSQKLKIKESMYVVNPKNLIGYKKYTEIPLSLNSQILFKLYRFQNIFYLISKIEDNIVRNPNYFVLHQSLNGQSSYKLKVGNEIKLGSLKLRVRNIHSVQKIFDKNLNKFTNINVSHSINYLSTKYQNNNEIKNNSSILDLEKNKCLDADIKCRICLESDKSQNNINLKEEENEKFIITPCCCKGDSKYIHLSCLKKWLKSKYNTKIQKTNTSLMYNFQNTCEICKGIYPDAIKVDGYYYNIGNFIEPSFENYIEFEYISDSTIKKILIIRLIYGKYIYLGKKSDNDFVFANEEMSQCHSKIFFNYNGDVILSDCNSETGTLIKIQDSIPLIEGEDLYIQNGDNFITISLDSNTLCCLCKFANKNKKTEKYFQYNNLKLNPNNIFYLKENDDDIVNNYNNNKNNSLSINNNSVSIKAHESKNVILSTNDNNEISYTSTNILQADIGNFVFNKNFFSTTNENKN